MRSARSAILTVSLMVFCLALGVIMGSGPLRTAIVSGAGSEGEALRLAIEDRDRTIADLEQLIAGNDEFINELAPVVTDGRLSGVSVLVVAAHEATPEAVTMATNAIEAAGGQVVSTATIAPRWVSNEHVAFRNELAEQIAADVGVTAAEASPAGVLNQALAMALVGVEPAVDPTTDPSLNANVPQTVREILQRAELLESADVQGRATLVVMVMGDQAEIDEATSRAWAAVATAFRQVGAGAVIATGPTSETSIALAVADATEESLVSVVADAWSARGMLVLALAADEQMRGGSGVYGAAIIGQAVPTP